MPDTHSPAEHEQAVASLAEAIAVAWPSATQVDGVWLRERFPLRKLVSGWVLPPALTGLQEDLVVGVDAQYPHSLPRFGLVRKATPCEMPHVEFDGIFCLIAGINSPAIPLAFGHLDHMLDRAVRLYASGSSGENREDFLDEFVTYWTLGSEKFYEVEAWLKRREETSPIWFQQARHTLYVASSKDDVKRVLRQRGIAVDKEKLTEGLLVHLDEPLYPADYPKNSRDLLDLLRRVAPEQLAFVHEALGRSWQLLVVLAFEWKGETMMGACIVELKRSFPHPRGHGQQLVSGMRKRRFSSTLLYRRIRDASFPVHRAEVTRIDSDFLLSRTTGARAQERSNATVAVFGCGALGASIAVQLAQAGVRRLILADGEYLTMQNIGRHVLGTKYVGMNKATAVKDELLSRFVDLDVEALPTNWDKAELDDTFWTRVDIIVSATGDWLTDVKLNSMIAADRAPPTVFTWVERFALAGHSLYVVSGSGCLRCVTNATGDYVCQVSRLGGELPREAGCGAFYQPYSACDASVTVAMATRLTLEALGGAHNESVRKTWVGAKSGFVSTGAGIMPGWYEQLSEQDGFERTYTAALQAESVCAECQ
ncbi:ThiF family adenylyltransferase [Ralstonia chuxiongensis]|uniref:ThiF family adenylyltransferase n=1 Tax=Ralstonia chuxiongensis TaxID=2957504 RepID=A0AA42BJ88_9RALS|nr:ThiF family adenylyltransferase [Ralstonia chuxiongensis]MCP1174899.1 ThiF family adenylyltransferase [Ralstonia chuxiongensis]